ncbi:MAG: hypothetical protein Q4C58_01630 [Eubacteriales bacterium]|nr:hypothetical protein [Eubacteriales bacterium]
MKEKYHAVGPEAGYAKGTFDPAAYENSALGRTTAEMRGIYDQYKGDQMNPAVLAYWKEKGVKKEVFDADKEAEQMMFSVLTPLKTEKDHKYPLIYCLHGGGEDIFSAEVYGYGLLTGMGNCITVCPTASTHGNPMVEAEFIRILGFLKEHAYPVDFTRVYVVGFSGGEGATQRLAMLHADKIAGIGPTPGPNSFRGVSLPILQAGYNEKFGLDMPMICLGGSEDGGDMWPLNTQQCVNSFNFCMQNVVKAKNYKQLTLDETCRIARTSPNTVSRLFGLEFDESWINKLEDTYIYFGDFYNEKGWPMARFGSIIGMPHIQCPEQAMLIWSFLRQFSRDLKTGALRFDKAEVGGANK